MKNTNALPGIPAAALLAGLFLAGAEVRALDDRDLLLYLPFDGSFAPVIARGNPEPAFGAKQPAFDTGVIGRSLVAGDPDVGLSYAVKENIADRSGTLSVWVKPLDWSPGDAQQHVYLQIGGRMLFYHYWEGGTSPFYWMNGSTVLFGVSGYPAMKQGEWNHVAIAWSEDLVTMYSNGKYVSHVSRMPPDLPRWADPENNRLSIGDAAWTAKGNNRTAFDELMVFNRPLSAVEVKALYRRATRKLPPPAVRLPTCRNAPVVDGETKGEEWDGAAGVTGFVDRPFGQLTRRRAQAKLTYDETNLYLLISSETGAAGGGDCVEVRLAADGAAAPGPVCRFRIAADGAKQQSRGEDPVWAGAWTAARGTASGADVVEAAIPFATLEVDPRTAKSLRLNLIRSWSDRYGDWASWADATLGPESAQGAAALGTVTLGGACPRVSVESLGPVHYAQLALQGRLVNPAAAPAPVTMTIRLQPTDLEEWIGPDHGLMVGEKRWSGTVVEADQALAGKPGVTAVRVDRDFKDTDINSVLVKAADADGTVLYAQHVPFVCTPPILIEAKVYPKHGRVDVVADVSEYREAAAKELAADLVFLDAAGKTLGETAIPQFRAAKDTASRELTGLPEGEITVKATLRKVGGGEIAGSEARFTKLAPGPWQNTPLGLDDIVIPPFTPIQVEGTSVSVWNRKYVWRDSLLPVEVHTGGKQVLAGPIEFYTGETPAGKPNRAAVSVVRQSPAEVVVEARGELDGIPVTARSTIEYDGMILTELVFQPQAAATLPRLGLIMPLKTEHAWLYHFFGKGGAVAETENARGPLRGDADVPAQFWLGTPEGGLGFFTVSAENWGPRKEPHVKLDGPVTRYTVPMAGGPYPVTTGMALRFGLVATPVKPMRDNWRFFRCGRDWSYAWTGPMTGSNNDISQMQSGWPEQLKNARLKTPLFVAYQRPDWMNLAAPEAAYYREEWRPSAWYISGSDSPAPGRDRHLSVCLGSDWQDFLLYHSMQITDAAGGDGFYYDGAEPIGCANRDHGHGFLGPDGKPQGVSAMLDYRRYYKRLAVELHKRKKNWQDYVIWLHQSNHFHIPAYSFATMGWDGEQFSTAATSARDYTKLMTPEYFAAEFHGKQFGYPVQWLGEFFNRAGEPPITRKEMDTVLCLALVTGTQELTLASNWAAADNYAYLTAVMDRAGEFGLSKGRAEFIGWWASAAYLEQTPADPKMKCALWKADGKALLMLGNARSGVDGTTTITVKPEALGLAGTPAATDWWTREPVPMEGNQFTVEVKGSSWRMIAITSRAATEAKNRLDIEPYELGLKLTSPLLPDSFIRWMVPEGYTYGEQSRSFSALASYKPLGDGGWVFDSALEAGSVFRITVTPHEHYADVEILIDNAKGEKTIPATGFGICCHFVEAEPFYAKDAYTRAHIVVDGALTALTGTDRAESLNGEMPVYAVKGVQYPENWAATVKNGYGWALSKTVADNSFICIASRDGQWVLGTFFDPVKQLSFNTKGERIHGCIHSSPYLPAVPPGKVEVCRGRLYLRPGTPQSLWHEYQTIKARDAADAKAGPYP